MTNDEQQTCVGPKAVSRLLDFDGIRRPRDTQSAPLRPELRRFLGDGADGRGIKPLQNRFACTDVAVLRQTIMIILAVLLSAVLLYLLKNPHGALISDTGAFCKTRLQGVSSWFGANNGRSEPANAERLTVRGIISSRTEPSAIVGSEIVRTGDEIAGAKVIGIQKDCVVFERRGRRWTQQIGGGPATISP